GQQLGAADEAVLAMPLNGGNRLRISGVVKGDDVAKGTVITDEALGIDQETARNGKPLLLLRDALVQRWSSLGAIGAEHAPWLRRLAASSGPGRGDPRGAWRPAKLPSSERGPAEWREPPPRLPPPPPPSPPPPPHPPPPH